MIMMLLLMMVMIMMLLLMMVMMTLMMMMGNAILALLLEIPLGRPPCLQIVKRLCNITSKILHFQYKPTFSYLKLLDCCQNHSCVRPTHIYCLQIVKGFRTSPKNTTLAYIHRLVKYFFSFYIFSVHIYRVFLLTGAPLRILSVFR